MPLPKKLENALVKAYRKTLNATPYAENREKPPLKNYDPPISIFAEECAETEELMESSDGIKIGIFYIDEMIGIIEDIIQHTKESIVESKEKRIKLEDLKTCNGMLEVLLENGIEEVILDDNDSTFTQIFALIHEHTSLYNKPYVNVKNKLVCSPTEA